MSTREERALALHATGYNCAQSVLGAFCEDDGLDVTAAMKVAGGLGGGLRYGEVCGAASGAVLALGLKCGQYIEGDQAQKSFCYKKTREFMDAFAAECGAVTCRDLLGFDVNDEALRLANRDRMKAVCGNAIACAVRVLEGMEFERDGI